MENELPWAIFGAQEVPDTHIPHLHPRRRHTGNFSYKTAVAHELHCDVSQHQD